jgi:hypothetical protein
MDIRKKIIENIRVLQESIKEDIDFYCIGTNILDPNVKRNARISNPYILMDEDLLELHKKLLIGESKGITQEAFNEIADLRPFLINSPKDYTQDCLHYLGDAAQKWWWEKKFTEDCEKIERLLEESKVTEAFEKYLSIETVRRYRETANELWDYIKEVTQRIGKGFDNSCEAEFLAIIENFKFLLRLSKRHHLKTEL